MRVDQMIAVCAGDRFGVVTRAELLELGVSGHEIDHRVRDRTLLPVHEGVYRHVAAPPSWPGRIRAAVLAAAPSLAMASGPSAMRLYGIRGVWLERPEITVAGAQSHDLRGVRVRRIDQVDLLDVTVRFGIQILSVPLALLALGATESERKVETAVHDAVHLHLATRADLFAVLDRYAARGRRGVTKFRAALDSLPTDGTATETNLELDMVRLLRVSGLPRPKVQYRVVDADGIRRRLDVAYPEAMLDIETDGDRWHTMGRDRRLDRRRDAALEALGWEVQRYGEADIHELSAQTVHRIRSSLAVRAPDLRLSGQRTNC